MIPPVSPLFYFPQIAATELQPELRAADAPEYVAAGLTADEPEQFVENKIMAKLVES